MTDGGDFESSGKLNRRLQTGDSAGVRAGSAGGGVADSPAFSPGGNPPFLK